MKPLANCAYFPAQAYSNAKSTAGVHATLLGWRSRTVHKSQAVQILHSRHDVQQRAEHAQLQDIKTSCKQRRGSDQTSGQRLVIASHAVGISAAPVTMHDSV